MKDFRIERQSGAPLPPFGGNARSQTVLDIWQPKGRHSTGERAAEAMALGVVRKDTFVVFFCRISVPSVGRVQTQSELNNVYYEVLMLRARSLTLCIAHTGWSLLPINNTLYGKPPARNIKTPKWTFVFHFMYAHVQLKSLTSGRKQKIISHHIPTPPLDPPLPDTHRETQPLRVTGYTENARLSAV